MRRSRRHSSASGSHNVLHKNCTRVLGKSTLQQKAGLCTCAPRPHSTALCFTTSTSNASPCMCTSDAQQGYAKDRVAAPVQPIDSRAAAAPGAITPLKQHHVPAHAVRTRSPVLLPSQSIP